MSSCFDISEAVDWSPELCSRSATYIYQAADSHSCEEWKEGSGSLEEAYTAKSEDDVADGDG